MATNQSEAQQKPKREARSVRVVKLPPALSVKQLADFIDTNPIDIIKQLMRNGIMANINQTIDFDIAALIAADFGFKAEKQSVTARAKSTELSKDSKLAPKPPVITIMGHVDHGKTSLLDAIRKTNVIDTEAGAITQHIGAYQVELDGRKITFLDTPGHEAFTAMRARGAQSTDIAVLVVAADDGIMPQTVEAINHAKAADVPIVIAINKIDKANANVDKLKQQLADHELLIEEWGGDTIAVPVSAKKKEGIHELLENLLVLADILELKANPEGPAEGVTIEAKLDKSMGPLATVLVQKGTLKVGDIIVIGNTSGKVKAMFNDAGKPLKKAEPATPAKILGLDDVAKAGTIFKVVKNEREARTLLEKYRAAHQEYASSTRALSLSDVSAQISSGEIKELNILLKTDVQGSIEPIRDSLERLSDDKIRVKVMHTSSGNITESDVMLALASGGIIIGFNTRAETGAQRLADAEGIRIRYYDVIYELINDVEKAAKGMLEPTVAEVIEGHAEVRAVFETKKTSVAGVMIKDGKVSRDSLCRVIRDGAVLNESQVNSLKRFKNDVKEVAAGFECGVGIAGFTEYKVGDTIEFYRMEQVA